MCTADLFTVPAPIRISSLLTADLLRETPASVLSEALMQLSIAERLVLSLTYFHELAIEDAATVMSLSSHDVLALHAAALARLSMLVNSEHS